MASLVTSIDKQPDKKLPYEDKERKAAELKEKEMLSECFWFMKSEKHKQEYKRAYKTINSKTLPIIRKHIIEALTLVEKKL